MNKEIIERNNSEIHLSDFSEKVQRRIKLSIDKEKRHKRQATNRKWNRFKNQNEIGYHENFISPDWDII